MSCRLPTQCMRRTRNMHVMHSGGQELRVTEVHFLHDSAKRAIGSQAVGSVLMDASSTARYCRSCGARLARDNRDTLCAPCQRQAADAARRPPDVPPQFWDTDLIRDALAGWHIGRVIYAYRHHPFHGLRPLPQELVAGWLGITQTQLSRIESGRPVKDLDRLIQWAKIFKIPSYLLWFKLPDQHEGRHQLVANPPRGFSLRASPSMPSPITGEQLGLLLTAYGATDGGSSDAAVMRAFRAA